jgi:hypothetical protein
VGLATFCLLLFLAQKPLFFSFIMGLLFAFFAFIALSRKVLSSQNNELGQQEVKQHIASLRSQASSPLFTINVRSQLLQISDYADGILADFGKAGSAPAQFQELQTYLTGLMQTLQGYCGVKNRSMIVDEVTAEQLIVDFEQKLPTYVDGFRALAQNADQAEAILSQVSTQVLLNQMQNRGRLS